jgi:hypothetical protein
MAKKLSAPPKKPLPPSSMKDTQSRIMRGK